MDYIRKIVRQELDKLICENIDNPSNLFSKVSIDDIDFDSRVSGQMELKLKFRDNNLQKIYTEMMLEEFDIPDTIIDVETRNMNNIHINAVPTKLRGIGLGKTIYRKVLEELDFITTGFNYARISSEAQRVWESLIKSDEYYYFIGPDYHRVTLAVKNSHPAIYETIINYYDNHLESTNFDPSDINNDDWD